ncbi:MAG: COR domain-containing protein, partial [Bacteroidota bacterium]
ALSNLKGLRKLFLTGNHIDSVRNLRKLTNLNYLGLGNNMINNLYGISDLKHLIQLDLINNELLEVVPLDALEKLEMLDLSDNHISDITSLKNLLNARLSDNDSDFSLYLYENPLVRPPMEIAMEGNAAIQNYFNQVEEQGEDYLFEAKLIIIGESGAGKTTFSRKVRDNEAEMPKIDETTRGIDVNVWQFPMSIDDIRTCLSGRDQEEYEAAADKAQKDGFRVNLWDFGGQEIYHSTHQFFLTGNSLYVLLADTRKQDTDFNYWLNTVEQLGNDSPLLIILNEREGHKWRIDEPGLRSRFNFFKERFEINLGETSDFSNLQKLRRTVRHLATGLSHIGDALPALWVQIRLDLNKEDKKHISFERYREICSEHGLSDLYKINRLSRYFHDIGVFLHYQDDPVLKNKVFLDANWTTKTVYKLLNDPQVIKKEGRFSFSDAQRIWGEGGDQDILYELLQLLERFSLAYKIDKTNKYIAPEHLPEETPVIRSNMGADVLRFGYSFDQFMPKGLMVKLIVALHKYIHDQKLVWRRGVVLQKEGALAKVVERYGNVNQFDIEITGTYKKEFLTIICEAFEDILAQFPRLQFERQIPCNCEVCSGRQDKSFYKLSDLKDRLEKFKATVECPNNDYLDVAIMPMLRDSGKTAWDHLKKSDPPLPHLVEAARSAKYLTGKGRDTRLSNSKNEDRPVINIYNTNNSESQANPTIQSNQKTSVNASATATNTITIEIQNILGETESLKEDIEDERELLKEHMKDAEIDVAIKDVEKVEKALLEVEKAQKENQEPTAKSKNRLKRFFGDFEDENSTIYKTLKALRKGRDYGVGLAEGYNKVANSFGLNPVPKPILEVLKKL